MRPLQGARVGGGRGGGAAFGEDDDDKVLAFGDGGYQVNAVGGQLVTRFECQGVGEDAGPFSVAVAPVLGEEFEVEFRFKLNMDALKNIKQLNGVINLIKLIFSLITREFEHESSFNAEPTPYFSIRSEHTGFQEEGPLKIGTEMLDLSWFGVPFGDADTPQPGS